METLPEGKFFMLIHAAIKEKIIHCIIGAVLIIIILFFCKPYFQDRRGGGLFASVFNFGISSGSCCKACFHLLPQNGHSKSLCNLSTIHSTRVKATIQNIITDIQANHALLKYSLYWLVRSAGDIM